MRILYGSLFSAPALTLAVGLVAASLFGAGASGCHSSRGVPDYDPCTPGQLCEGVRSTCVEIIFPSDEGEGAGSICTEQACHVDADCPVDVRGQYGACLGFEDALRTCFERCDRTGDCPDGWTCRALAPTSGETVSACVPDP